jgi:hypothetical protein
MSSGGAAFLKQAGVKRHHCVCCRVDGQMARSAGADVLAPRRMLKQVDNRNSQCVGVSYWHHSTAGLTDERGVSAGIRGGDRHAEHQCLVGDVRVALGARRDHDDVSRVHEVSGLVLEPDGARVLRKNDPEVSKLARCGPDEHELGVRTRPAEHCERCEKGREILRCVGPRDGADDWRVWLDTELGSYVNPP